MRRQGKFIVLDGLDGSGKGTQVKRLGGYLFDLDKMNHVCLTREPYRSEYYQEIRRILKESKNPRENAETLANLFVKDRRVHVRVIERHLEDGTHTACDRYKYATLAYQQTQGVPLERLIKMHEGILVPDLAIILDIPAEAALKRLVNDSGREYKEVFEKLDFQEKLRKNFLALPKKLPNERIVIINGNQTEDEVFEAIKAEVDRIL